MEKLAVQLLQRLGILYGHFWRELAAALAGADLLPTGPAVHIAAAFQFDEIAAVAKDRSLFKERGDGFHCCLL